MEDSIKKKELELIAKQIDYVNHIVNRIRDKEINFNINVLHSQILEIRSKLLS
jgi:hypothetical protein